MEKRAEATGIMKNTGKEAGSYHSILGFPLKGFIVRVEASSLQL